MNEEEEEEEEEEKKEEEEEEEEEEKEEDNAKKETDSLKLELQEKLLKEEEEEEDTEEIIRIKFNYVKKNINEISKILNSKKEKNSKGTPSLNILIPFINKISKIVPKVQNQLEKKCCLIFSNLCNYEASNGEVFNGNNIESPKIVQLSCGHYCHEECLNSMVAIQYPSVEKVSPDLVFRCPTCFCDTNLIS
ncbi:hypothetical protein H8356DRAFT_967091 [Neocallimastix lanati (nom. inval.)]|nr:hypothetical protein H8356DRAFT_967091 [Neocallimastix sp. JGI-2020a]